MLEADPSLSSANSAENELDVDVADESSSHYENQHAEADSSAPRSGKEATPVLAARETQFVKRSKIVMYVVLALAACGTGIATYFFLANQEDTDFVVYVSPLRPKIL